MAKKLILLGMALAAVAAFAMPAVAAASPELRDAGGKVAVGAEITGTSTNALTTETKFGTLECAHVLISGKVTANTGSSVAGKGTGGETTTCNAGALELTVTNPELVSMSTSGGDKGTLSMSFIADVGGFECHYEGSGGFTYGTGSGNDTLSIAGVSLNAPEICLKEDEETGEPVNPTFEGTFTLTTENNGNPLWIQ